MSKEQRARIDAMLRQAGPQGPRSIEQRRAGFRVMMARAIVPTAIRSAPMMLASRPALLVEAEPRELARPGTILYFHGGGYVVGSPETALCLTGNLVAKTGFRAFSLDYRLAPEHPFPAAVEDALSAYRTLLDDGVDPASLAFAGDSAGGGLSISCCLAARDAQLPLPAALVAFSPTLDATFAGESMDTKAGVDPIFTRERLAELLGMYLAGQNPAQPLLSPAVCADLSGLPPILLQAGANEVLLDDATRLAARARAAGVDVILDITADAPHVFQAYVGLLDEADEALDRAALFLSQRLRRR